MVRICINLIFDAAVEQATCTLWNQVANSGIFVRGLSGYRPHMTLAVYEVEQPSLYKSILDQIVSTFEAFPVLISLWPSN